VVCLAWAGCAHADVTPALSHQGAPLATSGGYSSLYSFGQNGKSGDGHAPLAEVIAVAAELYGTTQLGGKTSAHCPVGCGAVFATSIAGAERVIYRFKGGSDGAAPAGGLIDVNGTLYGTTSTGGSGSACSSGCGTVFKVSLDGKSEAVLYSFKGGKDGAIPLDRLVLLGGSLFGTTQFGGNTTGICSSGCGTVFKIGTSGGERVLYRFKGSSDGARPVAGLLALNGALYGTTPYGGRATRFCATGCGTLFELSTGGTKKTIHSFTYSPTSGDGAYPAAAPIAMGGELYGTTLGGGTIGDGVVFKANLSTGVEHVIHSFICCATKTDGFFPVARLTRVGGAMYGTTRNGGTANGGTIFVVTASGAESVLHDFTGQPDGASPQASLLLMNGSLYGTTVYGGSASQGTVFSLKP
jgi:uncharacterized repeat protein (TIGR03803 family)